MGVLDSASLRKSPSAISWSTSRAVSPSGGGDADWASGSGFAGPRPPSQLEQAPPHLRLREGLAGVHGAHGERDVVGAGILQVAEPPSAARSIGNARTEATGFLLSMGRRLEAGDVIPRLGAHQVRCRGTLRTCVRCGSRRPAPRVVTAAPLAATEPDFGPCLGG